MTTLTELIAYLAAHDLPWQLAYRRYGDGWRYGAQVVRSSGYADTAFDALLWALRRHEGWEGEG